MTPTVSKTSNPEVLLMQPMPHSIHDSVQTTRRIRFAAGPKNGLDCEACRSLGATAIKMEQILLKVLQLEDPAGASLPLFRWLGYLEMTRTNNTRPRQMPTIHFLHPTPETTTMLKIQTKITPANPQISSVARWLPLRAPFVRNTIL